MAKELLFLGIETSCDETAAAIVTSGKRILSNKIASQFDRHQMFGGVVPEIAARAHSEILPGLIKSALQEAAIGLQDLTAIGVTSGPGLVGGLMVGAVMAKAVAFASGKPVLAVNHLAAHALSARLTEKVEFPYLLLLISGGHSQFLVVEGAGKYHRLGATLDDAVGEAFDKAAKLLGLNYPGGPALEQAAKGGNPERFSLPRPLMGRAGCDLSLAGLKTAVRHLIGQLPQPLSAIDRADIAASFQAAIADMLRDRLQNAIAMANGRINGLVVAGGVAANQHLRQIFKELAAQENMPLFLPPLALCGDNAAMIAWAAIEEWQIGKRGDAFNFPVHPRWPLDMAAAKAGAKA
ncbi:MAG: tRNA (adenosine(37)-N6)-threonylcarbamoyltransferase complex transferase subunit TsaD [Dongiaceae bacterium]